MTPTPAFPGLTSPFPKSPTPTLYLALFISSASLLAHPPFSLLSQIPLPVSSSLSPLPFLQDGPPASLLVRGKVLNLWSLHLKTFLTFPSPLLSLLDWFPTLSGFTAYVANDEHVLFVCFDPSSRRPVNAVVLFHMVTLLPTSSMWHIHLSVLYIASGAHRRTFKFFLSHQIRITCTSSLPLSHSEPRPFLPNCCQEHLGSLSFILPITLWRAAASVGPLSVSWPRRRCSLPGCAAGSVSGLKYSNEFLWYADSWPTFMDSLLFLWIIDVLWL